MNLTTTTARIDACNPCYSRRARAMKLLGITGPSDEPIAYAHLLDVLGLIDALWCCRVEPQHAATWRRYSVWCARQVQHLLTNPRSLAALDVAERHAEGKATDQELAAAAAAARDAARDAVGAGATVTANAAWAAADTAWAAADITWAASAIFAALAAGGAGDAAWAAMRQRQAEAFRQLVTTGELPA